MYRKWCFLKVAGAFPSFAWRIDELTIMPGKSKEGASRANVVSYWSPSGNLVQTVAGWSSSFTDENWQKNICAARDDGIGFKSVFLSDTATNERYPLQRISTNRVLCSVKLLNGVLDESFWESHGFFRRCTRKEPYVSCRHLFHPGMSSPEVKRGSGSATKWPKLGWYVFSPVEKER